MQQRRIRVCKIFHLEMAHQLLPGCESFACSDSIHGHSYKIEVTLTSDCLDSNGMVVDFAVLKALFHKAVFREYDHALVLPAFLAENVGRARCIVSEFNPTAEVLASVWFEELERGLVEGRVVVDQHLRNLHIESVKVWETESAWAEVVDEKV